MNTSIKNIEKKIGIIILLLLILFTTSLKADAATLKTDQTTYTIGIKQRENIQLRNATLRKNGYYWGGKKVSFKSSNRKVCSVNKKTGNITGKKTGNAKIYIYVGGKKKKTIKVKVLKQTTPKTWIVAQDGSGHFMHVTDAVNTAKSGDTIMVKKGIYENESIRGFGKVLYIYGESPQTTILRNTTNTYGTPPMEFSAGKVENLTLYAMDTGNKTSDNRGWTSYAVHIDHNFQSGKGIYFKNCVLKSDVNAAVGIGTRNGFITFENCEFYSRDKTCVLLHDTLDGIHYGNGQYFSMINCKGSTELYPYVMEFYAVRTKGSLVYLNFQNNHFTSKVTDHPYVFTENHSDSSFVSGRETEKGTFMDLVHFYYNGNCYGNNIDSLNH